MKDKVLHIISGDLWGGAEAQVLLQVSAMLQRGANVEILLFNQNEAYSRFTDAGITCHLISESDGLIRLIKGTLNLVRGQGTRLIVAHDYKEAIVSFATCLLVNIKWISVFHGAPENPAGFRSLRYSFLNWLARFFAKSSAAKIISVSSELAQRLGLGGAKLEVIHNCVNLSRDSDDTDVALTKPAFVIAGRLTKIKRVDLAIEAFSTLTNTSESTSHLHILGSGPDEDKLKSLCKALSLETRVSFHGFVSNPIQYIANSDAVVISSDSEGVPTVLLEAMASGIPVASTKVGGIPEIAERLPGFPIFFAAPNNKTELATAMQKALDAKKEQGDRLYKLRTEASKLFASEATAERLLNLYKTVLQNSNA